MSKYKSPGTYRFICSNCKNISTITMNTDGYHFHDTGRCKLCHWTSVHYDAENQRAVHVNPTQFQQVIEPGSPLDILYGKNDRDD